MAEPKEPKPRKIEATPEMLERIALLGDKFAGIIREYKKAMTDVKPEHRLVLMVDGLRTIENRIGQSIKRANKLAGVFRDWSDETHKKIEADKTAIAGKIGMSRKKKEYCRAIRSGDCADNLRLRAVKRRAVSQAF